MKKKVQIINLHLFEREQLCEYFHDMAKQGWMLTKLRYGWMTFTACEPQDVSFVIDIYPHGSYLDPYAVDAKEILYGDMVEEYGYECICRYSNYQIFKYDQAVIPIHDEESAEQIKIQHRAIVKFELMNHVLFILLAFTTMINATMFLNVQTFLNDGKVMACLLEVIMAILFFVKAVPSLLWFLLKDRYHVAYKHILLRERIFGCIWYGVMISLILSLYFMTQSNQYVITMLFIPIVLVCLYYIIKLICKSCSKKHYVIISFALTLIISMQIMLRMLPLSISSPTSTIATTSELTRSDLQETKDKPTAINKREESSTFLSLVDYYEEYAGSLQEQGETYPITEFFGYELYTIHDTPLSSYIVSLIIDTNDSDIELVQANKEYTWYRGPYDRQYLIVGSHILVMQTEEWNTNDISTIIKKLHLFE